MRTTIDFAGGSPGLGRLFLGKDLSQAEGASLELPPAMLLVLDDQDRVHLVALKDGILLRPLEEVVCWPVADVEVRIRPGRGRNLRAVEITYGAATVTVVGPWRAAAQRAALELIERKTVNRI